MYSRLNTCVLQGLNGYLVEVETDLARGLPSFNIVGLPDAAIKESKERVRASLKNSGFEFPLNRITINLAPADLRKEGSQIDLSIAVGILASNEIVPSRELSDTVFLGELSLDGNVNRISGALPMIISLRDLNIKRCVIPYENREECGVISNIEIIPVKNLKEVVSYLNKQLDIEPYARHGSTNPDNYCSLVDFVDIKGQESLKRALEITAAGSHNMLIIGPPGSGKTMAARRLPTILPLLSLEESIEVTKIYSVAGLLPSSDLIIERPFRSPHHTSSNISLIGGGRIPKPGEVSLAHNGVLFLDELPEFNKSVIETLRQPIEDGIVNISRINATLAYPAKFIFIVSMNPCPCGYYGDPTHECTCSQREIDRYLGKISHPLLDRIDLHIEVTPVKYDELQGEMPSESSKDIRDRVIQARDIQLRRYQGSEFNSNAHISSKEIQKYCALSKSCELIMKDAFKKFKFSARTYNKILKVSRTIADLDGSEYIEELHLLEAIRYRSLSNKYWG